MNETNVRIDGDLATRSTRERVLDAAERLFAERGYDGASLRAITAQAGVNLAAVNYHFRSKESLIHAVFARRLEPLNRKRLAMLDACEASAGPGPPALEEVVRALIAPVLRIGQDSPPEAAALKRLMGRMFVDPGRHIQRVLGEQFHDPILRFVSAFRRALPGFPPEELFWRMHFSIGAMACTLTGPPYVEIISSGRYKTSGADATIERLVTYICGGIRAPLPFKRRGKGGEKGRAQHRPGTGGGTERKDKRAVNHRER